MVPAQKSKQTFAMQNDLISRVVYIIDVYGWIAALLLVIGIMAKGVYING